MVFHYYFDLVAWIALVISAFSLIVTYRMSNKSNIEKDENYRFKIITKIKNYNIDLTLQIDRIETTLKDHFALKRYDSEDRNLMNSTRYFLLPELICIKDEINKHAKNITDYQSNFLSKFQYISA